MTLPARTDKRRADQIARDYTAEAIGVIVDVMQDPLSDPKERLKAAEMMLERGEGKVAQAIIALPASKRMVEQMAAMSDEDLYGVVEATPLPRLGHDTATDADFEPVTDRGATGEFAGNEPDFQSAVDPNDPILQ